MFFPSWQSASLIAQLADSAYKSFAGVLRMPISFITIKIRFNRASIGNMGNGRARTVIYSELATLPIAVAEAPTGNHGQSRHPHSDLTKTR
jgi:hypothetical protein